MNRIKSLFISIIIVVVIIFILLLLLLFANKDIIENNNIGNIAFTNEINNINVNRIENNIGNNVSQNVINWEKYNYEDKIKLELNILKHIENKEQYFTIKALYNNYLLLIQNKKIDELMNVLADSYKQEYGITKENILEKINFVELKEKQTYKSIIMEAFVAQIEENTKIYVIKGNCRITGVDLIFEANVIIKMNTKEKIYEIYPNNYIVDNKYNTLKLGDTIEFTDINIVENSNNKFAYVINEEYAVAKEYLEHYKELLLYYPEEAYKRLDQEYYESRFENMELYEPLFELDYEDENEILSDTMIEEIEKQQIIDMRKNYDEYLVKNLKRISRLKFTKYRKYKQNEYEVVDNFGNSTIFKTNGFLNYTVLLDGYHVGYNVSGGTIEGEIIEFQNIINTKDFQELYFLRLDEKFLDTNFKNFEDFKKYMEETFYTINEIKLISTKQKDGYDVYECKLINKLNKRQQKKLVLILGNNNISFNVEN